MMTVMVKLVMVVIAMMVMVAMFVIITVMVDDGDNDHSRVQPSRAPKSYEGDKMADGSNGEVCLLISHGDNSVKSFIFS